MRVAPLSFYQRRKNNPSPPPPPSSPPCQLARNEDGDVESCSICLTAYDGDAPTVKTVECGHVFHSACFEELVESRLSLFYVLVLSVPCPICRAEIHSVDAQTLVRRRVASYAVSRRQVLIDEPEAETDLLQTIDQRNDSTGTAIQEADQRPPAPGSPAPGSSDLRQAFAWTILAVAIALFQCGAAASVIYFRPSPLDADSHMRSAVMILGILGVVSSVLAVNELTQDHPSSHWRRVHTMKIIVIMSLTVSFCVGAGAFLAEVVSVSGLTIAVLWNTIASYGAAISAGAASLCVSAVRFAVTTNDKFLGALDRHFALILDLRPIIEAETLAAAAAASTGDYPARGNVGTILCMDHVFSEHRVHHKTMYYAFYGTVYYVLGLSNTGHDNCPTWHYVLYDVDGTGKRGTFCPPTGELISHSGRIHRIHSAPDATALVPVSPATGVLSPNTKRLLSLSSSPNHIATCIPHHTLTRGDIVFFGTDRYAFLAFNHSSPRRPKMDLYGPNMISAEFFYTENTLVRNPEPRAAATHHDYVCPTYYPPATPEAPLHTIYSGFPPVDTLPSPIIIHDWCRRGLRPLPTPSPQH